MIPENDNLQAYTYDETLSPQEIREELDRLLRSSRFSQSERLGRFLRFTIEHKLAGNVDRLKEYVIGSEVYDRKPPYHPSQDSIVRTEARRLRSKLKEYYESEGKGDPVFIYFRPGAYAPMFRRNETEPRSATSGDSPEADLTTKGSGVAVGVIPLEDLSATPLSAQCAQAVTEELIHHLTLTDGVRVIAIPGHRMAAAQDLPGLAQKLGINAFVEGMVREETNRLRVSVRVLGADEFQLSSHRFETECDAQVLAQVQEQMATAFISRARPDQALVRRKKATPSPLSFAVYPLLMHAEALLDEGPVINVPAALQKFQEARELAPSFSRPYCGLAHCRLEMALRGAASSAALASLAKQDAQRAIELDPERIESYSCMAGAQALAWEWRNAEDNFLHALSLGTHVSASRRYGLYLAALGRFDEASHYLEAAQRIDPFSNRQKVVRAKFFHLTRRFEEGLLQWSQARIYGPLPVETQFLAALMAAHLGKTGQAKNLAEGLRSAAAAQAPMMAGLAEILALCGETGQAQQIAQSFKLLSKETSVSRVRQGLLALALGNHEGALSFLEMALADREAELAWIAVDPRFDPLRETESFKVLSAHVMHQDD